MILMMTVGAVKKFRGAAFMNKEKIYITLLGPHASEKAARLGDESNYYVFKVATKTQQN